MRTYVFGEKRNEQFSTNQLAHRVLNTPNRSTECRMFTFLPLNTEKNSFVSTKKPLVHLCVRRRDIWSKYTHTTHMCRRRCQCVHKYRLWTDQQRTHASNPTQEHLSMFCTIVAHVSVCAVLHYECVHAPMCVFVLLFGMLLKNLFLLPLERVSLPLFQ